MGAAKVWVIHDEYVAFVNAVPALVDVLDYRLHRSLHRGHKDGLPAAALNYRVAVGIRVDAVGHVSHLGNHG